MEFDKWFNGQEFLVKVLLLVIPFVNWVVEILVRVSAFLRNKSNLNLVGLIVYIFFGWFLGFADLILTIVGRAFLFLE